MLTMERWSVGSCSNANSTSYQRHSEVIHRSIVVLSRPSLPPPTKRTTTDEAYHGPYHRVPTMQAYHHGPLRPSLPIVTLRLQRHSATTYGKRVRACLYRVSLYETFYPGYYQESQGRGIPPGSVFSPKPSFFFSVSRSSRSTSAPLLHRHSLTRFLRPRGWRRLSVS